jgi:hypothetical protein
MAHPACHPSMFRQWDCLLGDQHKSAGQGRLNTEISRLWQVSAATQVLPRGIIPMQDRKIGTLLPGWDQKADDHRTGKRCGGRDDQSGNVSGLVAQRAGQARGGLVAEGYLPAARCAWDHD